jgi:phosphatidate cytidylyltransferase
VKTRIISAVIAVPAVFCVIWFLPPLATGIMMGLIIVVCFYEVLKAFGTYAQENEKSIVSRGLLPAIPVIIVTGVALLTVYLLREDRGAGPILALLPFISAFVTDAGAYFIGVTIGKHRIFPKISPKKSLEGFIGGIIFGTGAVLLYGFILRELGLHISYKSLAILGACGAVATEVGDLLFSWLKRRLGIKDYGSIIPGHGGMLDRFDSMVLCAPVIWFLVTQI